MLLDVTLSRDTTSHQKKHLSNCVEVAYESTSISKAYRIDVSIGYDFLGKNNGVGTLECIVKEV